MPRNGRKPGLFNLLVLTEALMELKKDSGHHHKTFGGAAAVRSATSAVSQSKYIGLNLVAPCCVGEICARSGRSAIIQDNL